MGQNPLKGFVFCTVHVVGKGHQFYFQLAEAALPEGAGQLSHAVHAGRLHHKTLKRLCQLLHTRRHLKTKRENEAFPISNFALHSELPLIWTPENVATPAFRPCYFTEGRAINVSIQLKELTHAAS